MINDNCLQGISCPNCGNEDRFLIAATILADVTDDGADIARHTDMEWDEASSTRCPDCGISGPLAKFSGKGGEGKESSGSPASPPALPLRFDDYEINGVKEFVDGDSRCCEVVDDAEAEFWRLYGHIPGEGVACIGDFKSRVFAEETYARITGKRYGD